LYDEIEYPTLSHPQSHPNRLATLAILLGIEPELHAPRVLEVGCGSGVNATAMAIATPGATVVGIDLAEAAIARGQELLARTGVANVSLRQMDLSDLAAARELGEFDFIVAHGVYSWTPPAVREALLELIRTNLAPRGGVAYVSYNAHPGGHLREVIRRAMQLCTSNIDPSSRGRAHRAIELIQILADAQPQQQGAYGALLREQAQRVASLGPAQVFHDDLGPFTDATYFCDFVEHARRRALQYLAEAELSEITPDHVPPPMRAALARLVADNVGDDADLVTDLVTREQHLDFLKGRSFRRTLLCHANVELRRPPAPARVRRLRVASPARPGSARPDLRSAAVAESFHSPKGTHVTTAEPLLKAALVTLCDAWPGSISFDDLLDRAAAASGAAADAQLLARQF
jgi:SAM-dependent methyltransferase